MTSKMENKITKSLVEEIVKEPIENFSVGPGANEGDNVSSSLLAIKALGKSGNVYNLVHKLIASDPIVKNFAVEFNVFGTERTAYCNLFPALANLVEKNSGTPYVVPAPKFFSGFVDGNNDYICLEDVRPNGYIMQDKFEGLNFEEVSLILTRIGEFHAATYCLIKYEGEKIFEGQEMKNFTKSPWTVETPEMHLLMETMFVDSIKESSELLKRKGEFFLGNKVGELLDDKNRIISLVKELNKTTDLKYFPCITHGDLWVNNIMIKYKNDDRTKPVDIKLVDFQLTRRSNIFEELIYFLMCSTTPEFRKNHFDQVLRIYYESFTGFLKRIKCPLPIGFSRGYLLNTMYGLLLPAYIYMTFAIPLQLSVAAPSDFDAILPEAVENLNLHNGISEELNSPVAKSFKSDQMRLKTYMQFRQLEKSQKGIERLIGLSKEMVDFISI